MIGPTEKGQIDFPELIRMFSRKKMLILGCVFIFLIPVLYYNHISSPIYRAETSVLFDTQRKTASIVSPFQTDFTRDFIANHIEEMKTDAFAEGVYDDVPEEELGMFSIPDVKSVLFDTARFIISNIKEGLHFQTVPNTDIVRIGFEYTVPVLAMIISKRAAEVLVEKNLNENREASTNVRKLVEDQLEIYAKQLEASEVALREFKETSNISISPDRESAEIFSRITAAEMQYNSIKSDREAAEKRVDYIQGILAQQREDLVPKITEVTSPWIQKQKEVLVDLEVRYTSLGVQNYSSDHPQMIKLKDEIRQTRENIRNETLKIAKGESIIDPLSQIEKYLEESIALDIEIETFKAQEEALRKIINRYNDSLRPVPEKELALARLMRDEQVNEQVYMMLLNKREEAKIAEAENVSYVRIINPPRIPQHPIRPNKARNVILGILLGCAFGTGLAFLLETLDNKIRTSEDIERISEYGVLAAIPRIRPDGKGITGNSFGSKKKGNVDQVSNMLVAAMEPKSPASEAFRSLRTNLQFSALDTPVRSILVTSSKPEAGKSTVSANLAITMAQMGKKTLLVDADMRKPAQHQLFSKKLSPGLMDLMISARSIIKNTVQKSRKNEKEPDQGRSLGSSQTGSQEDKLYVSREIRAKLEEIVRGTDVDNLFLLTSGSIPPNPSEALASKTMDLLIRLFKFKYEIIIFDSPPVLAVTDASILASLVDGVLLNVRSGEEASTDTTRTIDTLKRVDSKILGCILNDVSENGSYYDYYHYYAPKDDEQEMR
jgi:tyrosine-protein kinase Etk/Wzc